MRYNSLSLTIIAYASAQGIQINTFYLLNLSLSIIDFCKIPVASKIAMERDTAPTTSVG